MSSEWPQKKKALNFRLKIDFATIKGWMRLTRENRANNKKYTNTKIS